MRRTVRAVVCGVGLLVGAIGCTGICSAQSTAEPPVAVQPPETAAGKMLGRVMRALNGEKDALQAEDFAASFQKLVPFATFEKVTEQLRGQFGEMTLTGVNAGADERKLVAALVSGKTKDVLKLSLELDEQGKIDGLLVRPDMTAATPKIQAWTEMDARLEKIAPQVTFGVYEIIMEAVEPPAEGVSRQIRAIHTVNEESALAIGSTFKLWILGALCEEIQQGNASWDDTMKIEESRKSLPSGVMQNLKDGHEETLREFATKMISISDNTATDHLLHRVGREKAEGFMGRLVAKAERNRPFLGTRDAFALKLSGSDELPKAYVAADEAKRRSMLGEKGEVTTTQPSLLLAGAWKAPRFIDSIEWFASSADLAITMNELDRMLDEKGGDGLKGVLSKNPGVPMPKGAFAFVGYKGGSEPGVLNLTWLLHRVDGRRFILTIGLNNPKKAFDEGAGIGLAARAVEFLAGWDRKDVKPAEGAAGER